MKTTRAVGVLASVALGACAFVATRAPSAEAAPPLGFAQSPTGTEGEVIDDEGPTPDCNVDAGPTNLPDNADCQRHQQCQSGFCAKLVNGSQRLGPNGKCQACNTCNVVPAIHGDPASGGPFHNITTACRGKGGIVCNTRREAPCSGSHTHISWEYCLPGGKPKSGELGIQCTGAFPYPSDDLVPACTGQGQLTPCASGGSSISGYFSRGGKDELPAMCHL